MTLKTTTNAFFWLGEEGDLEGLTEEEFKMRQETWNGQRPTANEGWGGD
jgi:hypothetical protein